MFIFDTHCDSLSMDITAQTNLWERNETRQFDFAVAKGLNWVQVLAIFIHKEKREEITYDDFLYYHKRLSDMLGSVDAAEWIKCGQDLLDFPKEKQGFLLGVEGAEVLQGDWRKLEEMYRLGVRILGLSWNNDNAFAGGCLGAQVGLSAIGKKAVEEMNRLGIVIDGAHLSPQSLADVLECTTSPIIVSHADAKVCCDVARNLSDEQLRKIAHNGGVVGVTYVDEFLHKDPKKANEKILVEHIMHMAEVMGAEHVGLGSDFDGVDQPVVGLRDPQDIAKLPRELEKAGFTAKEIQGIMGENFRRVIAEII